MQKVLLILLLSVLSVSAFSQKLEYNAQLYVFGDNREFQSQTSTSQTIFGERASFEIGTTLEKNHHVRIGLNYLYEFGSEMGDKTPKFTAYYNYKDSQKTVYIGAFPRMGLIDFPLVLLSDTLNYYSPNIEGLYGKYNWKWGHECGFVDWTSRQTDTRRETFLAGFSGEIRHKSFFFQNYMTLFHFAGTALSNGTEDVNDNMAAVLYLGSDIDKILPLKKGYIRLGIIESSFRERHEDDKYVNGLSFTGEFYGEVKCFALKATFSEGDGHIITNGDPFYRIGNYIRTDFYWLIINTKHIQAHLNESFHFIDGNDMDSSTQLHLVYKFGN